MAYAQIPATLSFYIHLVGGKAWDVPSKPNHYETWAKGEKFTKDDILVFDFCTGMHTVAEVPKVAYDTCNTTAAKTIETLGPTTVTVSNVGIVGGDAELTSGLGLVAVMVAGYGACEVAGGDWWWLVAEVMVAGYGVCEVMVAGKCVMK
ncbi:umecyanin [Helianthus annuus]|uniref:umecyanin n=1 Tax=Helianthus annuus TaxID=4232 RepID=UPI000B8FD698|nr:umecyanin [Helianthus annuus]